MTPVRLQYAKTKEIIMAIRLGDIAPNFKADTTAGEIDFHEWKKDSWAVLFSHPKDYTCLLYTSDAADE